MASLPPAVWLDTWQKGIGTRESGSWTLNPNQPQQRLSLEPATPSAEKTRVLFVDDEPIILELIKMAVASEAGDWSASYVQTGEEALTLLEQQSFEVVVSDLHLPGIHGLQVLNTVMRQQPHVVRILLSGITDNSEALQSVGVTHLFLAKPFRVKTLRGALTRCRSLRSRLHSREIRSLLAGRNRLPSIPQVYFHVLEALQDPDCSAEQLGKIVAKDPGLTAKLLQLVNSAFFGFAREVSNAEEAVLLLGIGTLRALALTTSVFSTLQPTAAGQGAAERVWTHSLKVAQLAQQIAETQDADAKTCEQAFTAGLLHDVGKLILTDTLGPAYLEIESRAQKLSRPVVDLEAEILKVTHAEVGGYLLDLWGLPTPLVEAVTLHHSPSDQGEPAFGPLTAVHVADALLSSAESGLVSDRASSCSLSHLQHLGLSQWLPQWQQLLEPTVAEDAVLLRSRH